MRHGATDDFISREAGIADSGTEGGYEVGIVELGEVEDVVGCLGMFDCQCQ